MFIFGPLWSPVTDRYCNIKIIPNVLLFRTASRACVRIGPRLRHRCCTRYLGWNHRAALLDASISKTAARCRQVRVTSIHEPTFSRDPPAAAPQHQVAAAAISPSPPGPPNSDSHPSGRRDLGTLARVYKGLPWWAMDRGASGPTFGGSIGRLSRGSRNEEGNAAQDLGTQPKRGATTSTPTASAL